MTSRGSAVVLAVLLALSGCAGAVGPGSVGGPVVVDADNHWRSDVVVVSYESPADEPRDYEPVVQEALAYWTEHSEEYAGFDVELRLAEPGEEADVHVSFVEDVRTCGESVNAAGCAPRITSPYDVDRPVDVQVRAGLDHESSVKVLVHELGHTMGLGHGDEPSEYMSAKLSLSKLPTTNASDRANPWNDDEVSVYVDVSGLDRTDRHRAEQQAIAAIRYFDDGADGTVPTDVTVTRTARPSNADVVVRYQADDECISGAGSCGRISGEDLDGDGAYEFHTDVEITLVDLNPDAMGWHVGRWLGASFGLEEGEYPSPLHGDAGADLRRSQWWV